MQPSPVIWFEIYVDDMPRAKQFYTSVLQTELTRIDMPDMAMWSFPMDRGCQAPGAGGSLVRMPGRPAGGNGTLVYFACEDCGVEAARVASAGGELVRDKSSIGEYGFIALAKDTEGNLFGLHSIA